MRLYKLNINEENKVWRKYFTFADRFVCNEETIKSIDFVLIKPILNDIKIQALDNNGDVIKDEHFFSKEKMPEFSKIKNIFLIKEDIFDVNFFSTLKGINFLDIEVDGVFSKKYKLLTFDNAIDCIDEINSKRSSFDFFSKLIFDGTKVPSKVDGFFLKNWNQYGQYITIVNDKTKECLLRLQKAKDFLIFNEVQLTL